MDRRHFMASIVAAGVKTGQATPKANGNPRTSMGVCIYSYSHNPATKSALDFLEYCHSISAGGVQAALASLEPDYIDQLRRRSEELGMYVELVAELPHGDDTSKFEQLVVAAKRADARCLRAACLEGRRYENFSRLEDWRQFVSDSHGRIARALPIVEKNKMPLALENHKDWTADELAALMKNYSSEYLGVCLDTGNNMSLLDDPMDTVQKLAPYAVTTHFKDMALEEYSEGFLLSEVPLGQGIVDMRRVAQIIGQARPRARFTLEMITRDPLKIPCLEEKYWATFPDRNGAYLARALSMVRAHRPAKELPRVSGLDSAARRKLEEDNVRQCLMYAREQLGMTA